MGKNPMPVESNLVPIEKNPVPVEWGRIGVEWNRPQVAQNAVLSDWKENPFDFARIPLDWIKNSFE